MVIIKANVQMAPKTLAHLRESVRAQAGTGAVVLPPWCEVLAEVPDGTEVDLVAVQSCASDCDECGRQGCEYARSTVRRINCPLWRAKG